MRFSNHLTLPLLGVFALIASGCGDSGEQPAPAQSSQSAVQSADTAASEPAPLSSSSALTADEETATAIPAPSSSAPISCAADIGESAARKLVAQCRAVSPATRPPCNAENSCAMIRNEVARGCAILGEDFVKTPACAVDPIGSEAAADLVRRFYDAVNARDYAAAWSLWGPNGNPAQTLEQFANGYADTRRTHVEIGKVSSIEGGAGSIYVTVPVTIDAELNDGRHQRFTGKYDLRQINRSMGISQGWHITTAKLRPA
ncbi:nuclear transport factor 2 family protein [Novosphingobium sp. P6W]|uniref:nuclear transport factor 2 family protein n=1 Tax=Novosphingobium sp. P6W TaxID=1609758 RepID=UPI0005C317FA|nr:nuclear transport factor 2 family protein [Novosphingobium sp. P6W]AXB76897.1 hypothetical protein TQ38_010645 [Novosphingobium sp. P6W]KIS33260.1 hypothetical protein TQ38_07485 [Novosphingobium sp. P6W]